MMITQFDLNRLSQAIDSLIPATHKSWDRHIAKLGKILSEEPFEDVASKLASSANLDKWLAEVQASQGGMVGSASLNWPKDEEEALGLAILLARKFADRPDEVFDLGHMLFGNSRYDDDVREFVVSVFIPFHREFEQYLIGCDSLEEAPDFGLSRPVSNKVFLVHGRETGAKAEVARFLEGLKLDVIILHERPNRGRTLITKF